MTYSALGIIPARIGSTQVKRKNLRSLLGIPLIAYTIEAAKESNLERVIVSTDSPEIASIARRYGAEVPFLRPKELSSNNAKAMGVVRHCLSWLEENENWKPEAVAYLQPTSPMREAHHIDSGISLLDPKITSVISVVEVEQHPFYMFKPNKDNKLIEYVELENKPERRQDLPSIYCSNPFFVMSWIEYIQAEENKESLVVNLKDFSPLYISNNDSIDINTEKDFIVATELMKEKYSDLTGHNKLRAMA